MGKFIGIIAAALDYEGGEFTQTTELLDFPDLVWVYYCRPHLGAPQPGWADLAAETLRVSLEPPPYRRDRIEWQPAVTPDETTGAFEYAAEVMGVEPGSNLFHLALPPGFLPLVDSWDVPPLYGHADGSRFVLGWTINLDWSDHALDDPWPTFRFQAAEAGTFAELAAELGRSIDRAARERRRQLLTPWQPAVALDKATLLDRLRERLDLEGVRTLAFEAGIDYDELAGETKTAKLREMLLYVERQEQLPRLVELLRQRHPDVLQN